MSIENAWNKVTKSDLLIFVAKRKVTFNPVNGKFPKIWKEGESVKTRMRLFGLIPFGGIHTLYFEKINSVNHIIQTKENDDFAKVWNHKISLNKHNDTSIIYKDEIIIYAGLLTRFIAVWAKSFYIYRQKSWLITAVNDYKF